MTSAFSPLTSVTHFNNKNRVREHCKWPTLTVTDALPYSAGRMKGWACENNRVTDSMAADGQCMHVWVCVCVCACGLNSCHLNQQGLIVHVSRLHLMTQTWCLEFPVSTKLCSVTWRLVKNTNWQIAKSETCLADMKLIRQTWSIY